MTNIENIDTIAREILNTCGGQTFLHIGSGNGQLVQTLLANGIDAHGVDESFEAVATANSLMPGRFMQGNAQKLPYADKSFDTTVILYNFEHIDRELLVQAIKELKRVTRRSVYLRVKTAHSQQSDVNENVLDRNGWESLFFNENFRKHPSYYLVNDYSALGRESGEAVILLECISHTASERYPLVALKEERDLHMDMTREAGERSDAHIARYQWAATFVRPGDTVLDAACGLGYGSYILQCNTMAAKTIGIDGSDYAIDYANINFSPDVRNLSFSAGMLPEALNNIADNSVDVVISFETLEHIPDPESVLKEFHRVLTPAGRVIVSVPNDWSDETGEDPNPFHLHVYTLDKLRSQLKASFELENVTVQSATHYKESAGSKNWVPAKRELYEISTDIDEAIAPPSEWWLAVGMKSPLNAEDAVYHETQHKTFPQPKWNVTAFARDYKNPWLVRGMVDIGWRQKNKALLAELTEKVIDTNHNNSADAGAALCVKGYQLLNKQEMTSIDTINDFVERVEEYIVSKPETPHAIRWMISLHFVIAKLWLQAGMHDKARIAFKKCVEIDPLQFSPLLANRTVEAYLYLGKLSLNSGDEASAREAWKAGISAAQSAVTADWQLSLGDLSAPVEFALPELSSILDFASNCAYALTNLDDFKDKPWWWLQLQRSPHAQFVSLKSQCDSLRTQILSLDTFAASLRDVIQHQTTQLSEQAHSVQMKERELAEMTQSLHLKDMELAELTSSMHIKDMELAELTSSVQLKNSSSAELVNTINLKDTVIAEQAARLHEFNAVMQTRLMRLRNVMLYQPWGARKVMHAAYLSASLVTPRALRSKLQPVTSWLRNRFSRRPHPVETADNALISTGYRVKKPITKQGAPKIAHIIANFMTGGSSRLVVDLVEYLGHDYEQFVLTSYAPNPPAYIGLDIEEQRDSHDITPFINYLKRRQPDFVHVHYWGDVDEPWYAQAIEAARILDIPVIENINTPIAPHISDAVKRYVYVSDYVRHVFGRPDATHVTVYPGSDFSHFMRADHEAVPSDCVGMVYRLECDKLNEDSIKPFILIAQKRPKTKILIVGGGSLLSPFQQAVKSAGVEAQFEFTGYVDYDTLPDYYRRMSLFVAPVWKESFGQVSPFAMNMRVPVIGYDIGAISEIVNSKEMLAPGGDAESLADIAVELLNNDELRAKMGREHQQRAEENFSVQAMIEAYAGLYAEMAKK